MVAASSLCLPLLLVAAAAAAAPAQELRHHAMKLTAAKRDALWSVHTAAAPSPDDALVPPVHVYFDITPAKRAAAKGATPGSVA